MHEARIQRNRTDTVLTAVVTVLTLAHYLLLFVSFETGVRISAGTSLLVLILVALCAKPRLWSGYLVAPYRRWPRPIVWGVALYSGAAVWGGVVGILSGNPTRYVASQVLSFLLLPLAALAFGRHRRFDGVSLVRGLAIAALVALAVHVSAVFLPGLGPFGEGVALRFVLRNSVSLGAAGMIFLLTFARFWKLGGVLPGLGALASLVVLVGNMSRGAWIAVALGLFTLLGTSAAGNPQRLLRLTLVTTVLVASGGALLLWSGSQPKERRAVEWSGVASWKGRPVTTVETPAGPREVLSLEATPERATSRVIFEGPWDERDAALVRCIAAGEPGTRLTVFLRFTSASGEELPSRYPIIPGRGHFWGWQTLVTPPREADRLRLTLRVGKGHGRWLVHRVVLSSVENPVAAWVLRLRERVLEYSRAWESPELDRGMSHRRREWRAVGDQWSSSDPVRWIVGQGLGATFEFENPAWDERGRKVSLPTASYIHNFYVLLGFKLGIAGAAALAGLLLMVGWTWGRVRGWKRADDQWLVLGAGAAWVAYLVWSLTSPEIYDFRVAPLWGALVAACVNRAFALRAEER